jgi:hypothetical protein
MWNRDVHATQIFVKETYMPAGELNTASRCLKSEVDITQTIG